SAGGYTIGGSTITLDGLAGIAAIYVAAGSHTISSPLVLADDLNITVRNVSSTLNLTGAVTATGKTINKDGPGAVTMANIRASALNVIAGKVQIAANVQANDPAGASTLDSLSIAGGAQLDLGNNSLHVANASVESVRPLLFQGQLTSSSANSTSRIGYQTDAGGVDVEFALAGDTNLDGVVDATDLGNLALAWETNGHWAGGDFDYNGIVDVNDLALMAANWQGSGAMPTAALGLPDVSAVPEPGGLMLVLGGLVAVLSNARRRSQGLQRRIDLL
ncbi:MAG TPA: PEP-CTERM sorting domain-containing protein, partial [Tepidisphaeraceae bacterium]